jgi:hypothetical protein
VKFGGLFPLPFEARRRTVPANGITNSNVGMSRNGIGFDKRNGMSGLSRPVSGAAT